jgi:dienelactone hydrolase
MRILSLSRLLAAASGLWLLAACSTADKPAATTRVAASGAPQPLIARSVLFGNPERAGGQISRDGKWLGYIAPYEGVLNVWVGPAADPAQSKPITNDRKRGIRRFVFALDGKHILYAVDEGGDENFQVFAADLNTGQARALTPKGARAGIAGVSDKFPGEVLISVNDRDKTYFDLARIEIATGKRTPVIQNTEYAGFVTDRDFNVRLAIKQTQEGGAQWLIRDGATFKPWLTIAQEDELTTDLLSFTEDGNTLYMRSSRGRDTAALFALPMRGNTPGAPVLLHQDPRADVADILVHPVTGAVQAVSASYLRDNWKALDPAIAPDLERLQAFAAGGEFGVNARTRDDKTWVVNIDRSDAPAKTYVYDRASGKLTPWFDARPALAGLPLRPMVGVEIKSRDGLILPSYYTLPAASDTNNEDKADRPVPMVLVVHGGPWARDNYGFDPYHQWLANRGYAVLSVNFRGSTGFGKAFTNAGDLQWGRKMHDDLLDAVNWAAAQGITQRDKVGIMGGSYGGYAALAGLTMTPKEFACGISTVGPSNLNTLLASIPPYWAPVRRTFAARVGDPETEAGEKLLTERSPLTYVDRIERPLLIGQGANDPRVKQAESDQIVKAMQAKNIPVTYVLYPDEGHGFIRPQNRTSFNAVTEQFLGACLGGAVQPPGNDFAGSSLTVPAGANFMPGLAEALQKAKAAP